MPNPLTQARKLGFPLVNQDGFLTGLARMAAGVSPMDQIKTVLDARKRFDEDTSRELENAGKATSNKVAEYNLGRAPIEDAQKDQVFGQSQAERAARGAKLAGALVPGPPNPDGSSIVDPNAAIGMAEGQRDLYNLQNANPNEVLSPELGDMLGGSFKERIGQPVDRSQLQQGITVQTRRDAEKARIDMARERAAAAAEAAAGRQDQSREARRSRLTTTISQGLQSNETFKKYNSVAAEANGLKQLISNAKHDPNGTSDIAIVNMFQRLADPGVAVREGDVALIQAAQGVLPRVNNVAAWIQKGNRLTPQTRANMLRLIDPIVNARRNAALEVVVKPALRRALANGLNLDEIFPEEFINLDEGGETLQTPAMLTAPSSLAPGAATRRKNFLEY